MKNKQPDVHQFVTNSFDFNTSTKKIALTDIFKSHNSRDFHGFKFFMVHFNTVPIFFEEENIDCSKFNLHFQKCYKNDIKDVYYNKTYFKDSKEAKVEDIYYMLYDDLIVNLDHHQNEVRLYFRKTNLKLVEAIFSKLKTYKVVEIFKPEISLLVVDQNRISLKSVEINFKEFNINDHYNDDFLPVHTTIENRLSNLGDKGIVLLHGKPGTGKTSYIRYLITKIKKKIIFLPPSMANALTNPELLPLLMNNKNSILVIEDAENILLDRGRTGNSSVSALLNLSDGILSDCLNIQLVCSFNVEISKVDTALLRKGRLIARYEFNELSLNKTNSLSKKLGYSTVFEEPKTLTEIYNQNEEDYKKSNENPIQAIGFQNRNAS